MVSEQKWFPNNSFWSKTKVHIPLNTFFEKMWHFPPSNRKASVSFLFVVDKTNQTAIMFLAADHIKLKFDISNISLLRNLSLAQYVIMPVVGRWSLRAYLITGTACRKEKFCSVSLKNHHLYLKHCSY